MSYLAQFEIAQWLYPCCEAYLRVLHPKRRVPVCRRHYFNCPEPRILFFELLQYFKRIQVHLLRSEYNFRKKGYQAILR